MDQKAILPRIIYKYRYFLLTLYFLVLTCVFTRPLISKITTHTVGGYGDNLYFIWQIGWFKQAIFDLHQLPHKSHLLNHPYGYNLAITEIAPLQILIALPFTVLGNPVLGYNISMLATFFFSGLTMFYWVYQMTKSWGASLISSTAFAFLPYHCAHFLIGHLNISAIHWFPLYFMGFTFILTSDSFSWKNILVMSAGLAGIALTSQYYLYMTLITSMGIVIILLCLKREQLLKGEIWKQFLLTALISLPCLLIGVLPYYLTHQGESSMRSLEDVMGFSASITDFFLPFTKSILAGKWVINHFPRDYWNEATLYLGTPVLVLAIYGVFKGKTVLSKKRIQILVIGAILAFILALGTNLMWKERPVMVQTPDWMKGILHQDTFHIPLPRYWMFRYFPFYKIMRVWMRYGIIVMTMTCAMSGLGAARLLKTIKSPVRNFTAIGLTGLVILDFMNTPFHTVAIKPREVDLWLAGQPSGGQVQLPLNQSYEESAIFYTLTIQKPLIGAVRAFPSQRYFQLEPILRNFPDEASIDALKQEQITYILLDEKVYDINDAFIDAGESMGLDFAGSMGGQAVFVIK